MNQFLWWSVFPGTDMPSDCTLEQFFAARQVVWDEERVESLVELDQMYEWEIGQLLPETGLRELLRASQAIIRGRLTDARLSR